MRAGEKLKATVRLCSHGLRHDDIAMPVYDRNGLPVYPESPKTPNAGIRKIVVMHEFPMMALLIESVSYNGSFLSSCLHRMQQAFNVCGMTLAILNGGMSSGSRAAAISRFKNDPSVKVLLMSSVGMVGLNLTVADIVIAYVSHPDDFLE